MIPPHRKNGRIHWFHLTQANILLSRRKSGLLEGRYQRWTWRKISFPSIVGCYISQTATWTLHRPWKISANNRWKIMDDKMASSPSVPKPYIIFSRNEDEHISNVPSVLSLLGKAGIILNPNKCNFFTGLIRYRGDVIHSESLELADCSTNESGGLTPLQSVSELR